MAAKAVAGMKIRWAFARVGSIPTARTTPYTSQNSLGTGTWIGFELHGPLLLQLGGERRRGGATSRYQPATDDPGCNRPGNNRRSAGRCSFSMRSAIISTAAFAICSMG